MHNGLKLLAAMWLMMFIFSGCASKRESTIILVPDPDGHVGKAEVSTAGGSRILEQSGDMTQTSGPSDAPRPVTRVAAEAIASRFTDVLSIEPKPPEKFLLFFKTGKAVLTSRSQSDISTILDAIKRRGAVNIAISGHTDAVGTNRLNDKLSLQRAEMVKELLINGGVSPERITVSSHGKGNQLFITPDGVAEPRNRRVEVIIH